MAEARKPYVSVFKIDGKPILPPVVDERRRIELNRDKMRALEVERRLRLRREQTNPSNASNLAENDTEDTLVKEVVDCSLTNYDTSAAVESLLDDNAPTTIRDHMVDEIEQIIEKLDATEDLMKGAKPNHLSNAPLSLNIDSNFNVFDAGNLSPSFSLHSSPSLGALEDSRNQSLYFTPMSARDSLSSTPNKDGHLLGARLIRSNSFTVDKPSPMLLKHMANGIRVGPAGSPLRSPMALNEFRQNKNSTPSGIPRKPLKLSDAHAKEAKTENSLTKTSKGTRKSISPITHNSTNTTLMSSNTSKSSSSGSSSTKLAKQNISITKRKAANQSGVFKNSESVIRSIYETSKPTTTKVKNSAKKINASSTTSLNVSNKKPENPSIDVQAIASSGALSARNCGDILAMIEQQHAAQMKALLQRQQDEQQRMHEEFLRQQQDLLSKISMLVKNKNNNSITPNGPMPASVEAKRSNEKMLIDEVNSEVPVIFDANGNRTNRFTPESSKCIRRLYYDDNKLVRDELSDGSIPSSLSSASSDPIDCYADHEVKAANTLAAHMRGYLTRRLFQTVKVQTIVKTLRDTLLLILDLHYETDKNQTPADLELKLHLIQQLSSASQNLHDIFIEIPMAERMDIIAKDREWRQFKLNRSKSLDNNKSRSNRLLVNGNLHLARSQSARFEKKF